MYVSSHVPFCCPHQRADQLQNGAAEHLAEKLSKTVTTDALPTPCHTRVMSTALCMTLLEPSISLYLCTPSIAICDSQKFPCMGSDASHMHDQAFGLSTHGRILLQPHLRVDLNVNAMQLDPRSRRSIFAAFPEITRANNQCVVNAT